MVHAKKTDKNKFRAPFLHRIKHKFCPGIFWCNKKNVIDERKKTVGIKFMQRTENECSRDIKGYKWLVWWNCRTIAAVKYYGSHKHNFPQIDLRVFTLDTRWRRDIDINVRIHKREMEKLVLGTFRMVFGVGGFFWLHGARGMKTDVAILAIKTI